MTKIIDTHIHVWDFSKAHYEWLEGDTSILNRNYSIEELEKERKKTNVAYGVLVQAAINPSDTAWMLEVAENTEWIRGVVGWLPLQNPGEVSQQLENYLKNPYFKGVRHLIHDEKDPKWLLQQSVLESLQILADNKLPYDIVGILPEHIETALTVSEKIPELKMVFDHLNNPPIKSGEQFGKWGELMKKAAKHPNFHAKISGLGIPAGKPYKWTAEDILPYVELIIQHFGSDRCFCGGDWPVALLAGDYAHAWEQYKIAIDQIIINWEEQYSIYAKNANQFYNLNIEGL